MTHRWPSTPPPIIQYLVYYLTGYYVVAYVLIMHRRPTGADGFTLLELVVTLSLTMALAGIAAISHRAMRPGLDLSAAARQVVMDLKLARMRAVAEGVNHRIVFPDGASGYQPQRQQGAGYSDLPGPVPLPRGIIVANCTANGNAIGFRPRGNAATFGTITLRTDGGEVRQVIVNITGQVRVQ